MIEVRYTDNLTVNLLSIEAFLDENQFPQGFDRLVDELTETVIPNLARHPRMGRNFLQRPSRSIESLARRQKLDRLLHTLHTSTASAEVRE